MKRILLVADASPGIGWGHAMRTLAIAQELEGLASVRWATNTPEAIRGLDPPCPVGGFELPPEGTRLPQIILADGVARRVTEMGVGEWNVVDHGTPLEGINRICPHFGAESRDWGAGMVATGPQWMPLRREVMDYSHIIYNADGKILTYRAGAENIVDWKETADEDAVTLFDVSPQFKWWEHGPYRYAIVPPSTIAYECMALGIPVLLVPLEGQSTEIGDAMVKAGVAEWYSDAGLSLPGHLDPMAELAHKHVDGRGAERVANLLMED